MDVKTPQISKKVLEEMALAKKQLELAKERQLAKTTKENKTKFYIYLQLYLLSLFRLL